MKIKKSELKELIKEEIETVMEELQLDELFPAARKYYRDTFDQTGDTLDRAMRNVQQSIRVLNKYKGPTGIDVQNNLKHSNEATVPEGQIASLRKLLTALAPIMPGLGAIGASVDRPKAGLFNQWQEEYKKNLKAIKDGLDAIQNHPSNLAPKPDIGRADFSQRGYKTDRETAKKEGLPDGIPTKHFIELKDLLKRATLMIPKFKQGVSKKDIYKTKAYEPDEKEDKQ
ncbi:MAG: hypothetical protein VYA40_03865 [Pseudomonadota bacterium]|nr:hypothetical protein [Pseudomonadota bacterium]